MSPDTGVLIDIEAEDKRNPADDDQRDLEADYNHHGDHDCQTIRPDEMRLLMRKLHQPNPCELEKSAPHLFEMLDNFQTEYAVYRYHIDFHARTARAYSYCGGDYEEVSTTTIRLPDIEDGIDNFNEDKIRAVVTDYTKAYRRFYFQKQLSEEKMPRMSWDEFVRRAVVDGGVQEIITFLDGQRIYYIGGMGELVVSFLPGVEPCEHYRTFDEDGNMHIIERKEESINIASAVWRVVSNFFFWRY